MRPVPGGARSRKPGSAFEASSQADTTAPTLCQIADQWNNVIAGVVTVCQSGQPDPGPGQSPGDMATKDDWRTFITVIRRLFGRVNGGWTI
ncbi:MAG: hypothetical protein IPL78_07625 [Chloroflexi bacterium]|nr:hypothetical protein [Chloroflexota bacterium]